MSIFLDDDKRQEFVDFIRHEIDDSASDRSEREAKWERWRRNREAFSEDTIKSWPFPKSANMTVPLTGILSQGIYALLNANFAQRNPPWTTKAMKNNNAEDVEIAEVVTKYMTILAESDRDLGLNNKRMDIIYEAVTMGTEFVKIPWTIDQYSFKTTDDSLNTEEVKVTNHDGPEIVPIRLEDFLYRTNEGLDIQRQPWIAHRISLLGHELKNRETQGVYDNIDEVFLIPRKDVKQSIQNTEQTMGISESQLSMYDIHEVYAYWDVDDDGQMEDIIVTVHLPTGTILREGYNEIGIRPFKNVIYFSRPNMLEGRGICEMSEGMQEEATTLHRMRIDNANIAGLRMFGVRKNSGIKPNERIYPGKLWFMDDPSKDIVPIQAGEVYPSSMQAESLAVQYAQRFTGFNDTMGGFADQTLKSRDTLGGQALRLDQGQSILASVSFRMQKDFGEIGQLIYFQLVANKTRVIANENKIGRLTEREIKVLEKALSIPIQEVPMRLRFTVNTSKLEQTFEQQRQNMLATSQLLDQYYSKTIPLQMQLFGPQGQQLPMPVKESMMRAFVSGSKLMERVIELFNIGDPDSYVAGYQTTEKLLEIKDIMNDSAIKQMQEALDAERNRGINPGAGTGIEDQQLQLGFESGEGSPLDGELAGNTGPVVQPNQPTAGVVSGGQGSAGNI